MRLFCFFHSAFSECSFFFAFSLFFHFVHFHFLVIFMFRDFGCLFFVGPVKLSNFQFSIFKFGV